MRPFSLLFRPAVAFLNWTALSLMRLLRIPEPDKTLSLYSSEELAIVTDESAEGGELPELQREIIRNIFELEDLTADELADVAESLGVTRHQFYEGPGVPKTSRNSSAMRGVSRSMFCSYSAKTLGRSADWPGRGGAIPPISSTMPILKSTEPALACA